MTPERGSGTTFRVGLFGRKPVIDVRDTRPTWGKPTRCPSCDAAGYLDELDLRHGVMRQHCPDCWHEWETLESEALPA